MSPLFRPRMPGRASSIQVVNVREAVALQEHGAMLIDVREAFEWKTGHAPGATYIPLGQLSRHFADLPDDQRIVVVCRTANRSAEATAMLAAAGFDAANLACGMAAWARAGQPIVTDSGEPGTVA